MNDEALIELNKTLKPRYVNSSQRVGIFCFGQVGDTAQVMSVLGYVDTFFKGKEIVWYINFPNADLLRFAPINEVRPWPWAGNGLEAGEPDHFPYLCLPDNTLNLELAKTRKDTADLTEGYFPATHQVPSEKREGVEYGLVSKMVFKGTDEQIWRPYLNWSVEEEDAIRKFSESFNPNYKTILLETFAGSGQSPHYDVETTKEIMKVCMEKFNGSVNFVFGSHKHIGGISNCGIPNEDLFSEHLDCYFAHHFTPRQIALLSNHVDLIIGISSGISVVTSAWNIRSVPKIQWCGSRICSTQAISNGPFYLVEAEFKTKEVTTREFFNKLREVLETI